MECLQSKEFWGNYWGKLLGSSKTKEEVPDCNICDQVHHLSKSNPKTYLAENFAAHHTDQWIGCTDCKESHHEHNFCKCGACFFKSDFKQDSDGYTVGKCRNCGKKQIWD